MERKEEKIRERMVVREEERKERREEKGLTPRGRRRRRSRAPRFPKLTDDEKRVDRNFGGENDGLTVIVFKS